MKTRKLIMLAILALFPLCVSAEKVQIDGIWYDLVSKVKTAEVAFADDGTEYEGEVVIPETVTYEDVVYNVTSIGDKAFKLCSRLTSITIPNTVSNIGEYAFWSTGLTSVTIPNSVTDIKARAFYYCSELTNVIIGNSVESIGGRAFFSCPNLTSVIIPNSIKSIGSETFASCSNLSSVTFGDSVKMTGISMFADCSNLTEISIGNSVTDIRCKTFKNCINLTNIVIPNSVKNIEYCAFESCVNLTSITIGNSVVNIESSAFKQCSELTDVYCLAEKVPSTESDAFTDSYIEYATLHVPASAINDYKATTPWSGFGTFKTLSGEEVEVEKCATPTISYQDGKLSFACETEGVEFISEITDEDIKKHYEAEVSLTATYTVSVHATKTGCEDSETATAVLCWIECAEEHGSAEGDGVMNIPSTPVLIQSQSGTLTVTGLADGTQVQVYSTDGKEVGSGITANGTVTVQTTLQAGDVAIVKVGAKSIKVVVK